MVCGPWFLVSVRPLPSAPPPHSLGFGLLHSPLKFAISNFPIPISCSRFLPFPLCHLPSIPAFGAPVSDPARWGDCLPTGLCGARRPHRFVPGCNARQPRPTTHVAAFLKAEVRLRTRLITHPSAKPPPIRHWSFVIRPHPPPARRLLRRSHANPRTTIKLQENEKFSLTGPATSFCHCVKICSAYDASESVSHPGS